MAYIQAGTVFSIVFFVSLRGRSEAKASFLEYGTCKFERGFVIAFRCFSKWGRVLLDLFRVTRR